MGFKDVISVKGFWRSVVVLGILFIIIYNFFDIWFSYGFEWQAFKEEKFASETLLRFFAANILGGFCYGFIVVFFQFRGKLKREQRK